MSILSIKNISFNYRNQNVIKNISFNIKAGKFYAFIGPNGCGKSTLFNIIAGILKVKKGIVYLYNKNISCLKRKEIAKKISVLSQSFNPSLLMTIKDMVLQGRFVHQNFFSRYSIEDQKIVENSINRMELNDLKNRRIGELSGGQLQRTRMAMVLTQNTDILLLDEPTTFLDMKHQYAILNIAKELVNEGKTVLAILHDINHACLYADHSFILHNGEIYSEGKANDIFTEKMLEDVFEVKVNTYRKNKVIIYVPKNISE